jgi:hypothetical protein
MKLKETIKRVLKEDKIYKVINLINNHGLLSALDYFGGWKRIQELANIEEPTRKMAITFIKDLIKKYGAISVHEIEKDPIFYEKDNIEYKEIDFFGRFTAIGTVWSFDDETESKDIGEFQLRYEELDNVMIYRIFDMLMDAYENKHILPT